MGSWSFIESGRDRSLVLTIDIDGKNILKALKKHGGDNQLWMMVDGIIICKSGLVADIKGGTKDQLIGFSKHGGIN